MKLLTSHTFRLPLTGQSLGFGYPTKVRRKLRLIRPDSQQRLNAPPGA